MKQAAGKVMKVESASPDTGQQGDARPSCILIAHALSGKAVRALVLFFRYETLY